MKKLGQVNVMTQKQHERNMKRLQKKKELAEMRQEERKLKKEILKLCIPFHFNIKFSKLIVMFCIMAIAAYTVAAIFIQKYTAIEISPTLTTCVYAFFGTELISMAGIKMVGTKFSGAGETQNSDTFAVG